jgi:hypothetical protein
MLLGNESYLVNTTQLHTQLLDPLKNFPGLKSPGPNSQLILSYSGNLAACRRIPILMTLSNSQLKFYNPKKLCYDRRSIDQSILVSSTQLGLTNIFVCCLTVAGFFIWLALSDERTDLPLQLLLVLARAFILGSESCGTRDHILLSQIRDCPNLEGHVPIFISPGTGWPGYNPRHWGSIFVASYDSQGCGGSIRPRLHVWFSNPRRRSRSLLLVTSRHDHT